MSAANRAAEIAWQPPSTPIPRDWRERPLVVPPEGGKAVPYTRCTTFIDALEDSYNLTQYRRRMVAVGMALRSDLVLRATSLGAQPSKLLNDGADYKEWKKEMDAVCDRAATAASAEAKSIVGTSLHALTDRLDRGQDVGPVPAPYLPHLKAYEAATARFTAVHIERFLVNDELKVGGTADRILKIDGHPKLVVADTKTGDVSFGLGKICMQIALYAHSVMYNHETRQRIPIGDVDLDRGIVIALNAETGVCEPLWVDLRAGWEDVQLAAQVRAARGRKNLSMPYRGIHEAALPFRPTVAEENARDLTAEAKAALEVGIRNAASFEELVQLWTVAGNQWQDCHTQMASARKAELQRRLTPVG